MLRFVVSFILVIQIFFTFDLIACSWYKITMNNKTMVGSNFDAYYLTLKIWFENAERPDNFGAVFTGGRIIGNNEVLPQSGMNEVGLTYSRLAAPPPKDNLTNKINKKQIDNPAFYLRDILHTCKTVYDVKKYIEQFDYSYFDYETAIYADMDGNYLIVEADTLIIGSDPKFVLSNFCPSRTDLSTVKQVRYLNGVSFLKNKIDTTIAFCTALSDTMHVCREKIGDGTLLTSIYDLKESNLYLYFYHDYAHQIKFNLKDELAKGNHEFSVPELFPPNTEYQRLLSFKTPQNTNYLRLFMLFSAVLFVLSSFYFLIDFLIGFISKYRRPYNYIKPVVAVTGFILAFYMYVLLMNQIIFYFPAPYQDYKFSILNVAAYIPFLTLILLVPFFRIYLKIFKQKSWNFFSNGLFFINNLLYLLFIGLFTYWGFYSIF